MEQTKKNACVFGNKVHLHGSELCADSTCHVCNDGKWEKRKARSKTSNPGLTIAPGKDFSEI